MLRSASSLQWVTTLATLGFTIGCADRPAAESGQAPKVERRWSTVAYDTLWTIGGTEADTTFEYPSTMVSGPGRLYVADLGRRRVFAIDIESGRIRWQSGDRGRGPAEYERPIALSATASGGVIVGDPALGRVTTLSDAGRPSTSLQLDPPRHDAICAVGDVPRYLLYASVDGPFYRVRDSGERSAIEAPWWPGDIERPRPLALQARLTPYPSGGGCIVALVYGLGYALWTETGLQPLVPYVESHPLPVVKSSERSDSAGLLQVEALPHDAAESALSIATFADTLYVLFGGRSADAGRIVDRYDLRQSRYIGSLRLPGSASRMAVPAADLLVLADELDGFRRIVALRVRESR